MKLAFFTETYLPNKDGVVTSILSSKKELERKGHEVFIFCAGSRKAKRENKDPRAFYYFSAPFAPYPDYRIALFPFFSEKKVKRLGVKLVHSHGMATMGLEALRVSRSLKLPCVGSFHTLIPEATHYVASASAVKKITKRIAWKYLKWYYNKCDLVITPSRIVKEMLEEHKVKNVQVVPNGVDVKRFHPRLNGSAIRKKYSLGKSPVVLHVGRLVLEKNLDVLIDAALLILEEQPDCRFLIVGSGPAEKHYKEAVKRNGVSHAFTFTGFVPDEVLPSVYAAADVFAFPSKFETQGLVGLEAMACGKPVAGARYLAVKEIVDDGKNGFLFNPDDSEDCAEAILNTLEQRRNLSANARKTAEKYSIPKCTAKLLKAYEQVSR